MGLVDDLKPLLVPHYVTNILISALYFVLKNTPGACDFLFRSCRLEMREYEWLTFLACVVVLKNRKQSNLVDYVSTSCLFTKALSVICFFNYSPTLGILYILLCLVHVLFLPRPVYQGPEDIVYFRGPNLVEEIERDKRVTWLITFYVAWSPKCVNFAPILSELSHEYTLENLKFGKMDVSRFPDVAAKFDINTGALSRQLPTVILFQGGEEIERRPVPTKTMTLKFDFTKTNVVKEFQLNELYNKCKRALSVKKKAMDAGDAPEQKKDK